MSRSEASDHRPRSDDRRARLQPWVSSISAVVYILIATVYAWLASTGSPLLIWLVAIFVLNSLLNAAMACTYVTDWHGWGRRLWSWRPWGPPLAYARPNSQRLRTMALMAASLALVGDVLVIAWVTLA